ncbi:hypothetical protein ABT214_04100 [Micromonospora purpureochromogenes]|uniref:hypothetical protein n=1 Tax=Micromonospora purpureochromogenes TaxID=47872 RepID=UPI00332A81DD
MAKEIVPANLKAALATSKNGLVAELRQVGDVSLAEFLREVGLGIEDVYRSASTGEWAGLRRLAGIDRVTQRPGARGGPAARRRSLVADVPAVCGP